MRSGNANTERSIVPRGTDRNRRALGLGIALLGALASAGCVAPYVAYEAQDAARVRVVQNGYLLVKPNLIRAGADGNCEPAFAAPSLLPPAMPPINTASVMVRTTGPTAESKPAPMPRADMLESPDPSVSNVAELRVKPGAYLYAASGTSYPYQCGISGSLVLEPGRQYALTFSAVAGGTRCALRAERVETVDGLLRWVTMPLDPKPACRR